MKTQRVSLFLFFALLLGLVGCQREISKDTKSTLKVGCEMDYQTLDPRQARDLLTYTFIQLLYEGLTRLNAQGQPTLALAERIDISPDQKTYLFTLSESQWSDGTPLTAKDFEETWKSVLDPHFPAPNAYQFYVIKGAKAAKDGKISLNEIGVKALDDKTLQVELESPTPFFLHLTSTPFFSPASPQLRQNPSSTVLAFNGPFQMHPSKQQNEYMVTKNSHYWNAPSIHLDGIHFIIADIATALKLYQKGELDWVGSPLSTLPIDALPSLRGSKEFHIQPAAGTFWLRFNTENFPFNHVNVRQAFTLALNRQDLVEHVLQGNQQPALGLLPPTMTSRPTLYQDHHEEKAKALFQGSFENFSTVPSITLCYSSNERNHKIAQVVQQQWKKVFGIDVHLQSCEGKVFAEKLKQHDYQISIGSWFADIRDPLSFLEVFRFKNNGTNHTQWENPLFAYLLERSFLEKGEARQRTLEAAERVLIEEMPVAPLFFSSYLYMKKPYVQGIYLSDLGIMEFKNGFLERDE